MPGISEAECQAFLNKALEDERLSALWEGIRRQGGDETAPRGCGPALSMLCKTCGKKGAEGGARAFVEAPPVGLVLCANRLAGLEDVKAALRHELVHAYDMCAARKDLTRCAELAYSEVRAAREAECGAYREYGPWLGLTKVMRDGCVRDSATRATQSLFPGERGARCVAQEFERAMASLLTPEVTLSVGPQGSPPPQPPPPSPPPGTSSTSSSLSSSSSSSSSSLPGRKGSEQSARDAYEALGRSDPNLRRRGSGGNPGSIDVSDAS